MRTKCKTDKDFKKRMKEGVDPSDPDSISLAKIEILLRRNNPTLSEMIGKYHPRMTRLAREVADEYPEEPDPSREGEFWPPKKVEFEPVMREESEEMMIKARGGGGSGGGCHARAAGLGRRGWWSSQFAGQPAPSTDHRSSQA